MTTSVSAGGNASWSSGKVYGILAGKLFDSRRRKLLQDQVIMIDRELGVIVDVISLDEFQRSRRSDGIEFMDFGQWTIVPGFVDVHVHSEGLSFRTSCKRIRLNTSVFARVYRDLVE